ncbi:heterotrimeric G protein alpha subunit [Rickenella mellea]|uniref:Heterotrimeric G protein alpha subunit n=1 Tax=Rickenella mellea TaxID=50990 RepID=A0A4Y7QJB6_9AGAM|nr:heterotrimeric G protein alpha subunit [Rickenella mellea]
MGRRSLANELNDPLTLAIAPPSDETPEQRAIRLREEEDAKQISDEIDRQIEADAAELKRKRKAVIKVLLLGQSESGKSTALKNFQLTCAPKQWSQERETWRTVIQLNLTRSINTILDALPEDSDFQTRLGSLTNVQRELERRLGASSREEQQRALSDSEDDTPEPEPVQQEVYVRSYDRWMSAISKLLPIFSTGREEDAATRALANCRDDMRSLCDDNTVRDLIRQKRIRLEDCADFFIHHIDRIASYDYSPSDDDVVHARLRTIGVQEHRLIFEKGHNTGREFLMYDVGGSRSSRAAWPAYFDDVNAIIFLVPVNCFDERLAEDRRINRLDDSLRLWKAVCKNKLLAKTQLILFLNKCDLLEKKLKSGAKFKDYARSFDKANDKAGVTRYLRHRFMDISKQVSPEPRTIYAHLTTLTDTKTTAITLSDVQDGILQSQLTKYDLL